MKSPSVRVARFAMATRFEILLWGNEERFLRAVGEQALAEIERLERQLSIFRANSELSRINRQAARAPVRVEPGLFRLLQRCQTISEKTGGAFDITVGPLMHCWGFRGERTEKPDPEEVERVREHVGFQHVHLDAATRTVSFDRPGVSIDLGAVAKGWALDEAAMIVQEEGVENALLHGGTSTATAIGRAPHPEADGWTIAIRPPPAEIMPNEKPWPEPFVRSVTLRDESLSVSGIGGRFLRRDTEIHGHVLDPRTGNPVRSALLAAVVHKSATESDALSTALLAGGTELQETLSRDSATTGSLLLSQTADNVSLQSRGF